MPWKTISQDERRYELVRQIEMESESLSALCRRFKVTRPTAYKWWRRYRSWGLSGLKDRSRRPKAVPARTAHRWLVRLRALRRRHPTWGARKLAHRLGRQFAGRGRPGVSTISRWLKRWGLTAGKRRVAAGPKIRRLRLGPARFCNDVWTVDFKGWFRTGDGQRVDPLTVRDLYSRYGLGITLLSEQSIGPTRRQFVKLFKRYGLPRRIRSDNGVPFAAMGPTGLTRLSAWWTKLGIQVEFITPGRPCENGSHEQFHRVYKAEMTRPVSAHAAAQQKRSNRWLREYNQVRPHEGLQMRTPAELYAKSRRRYQAAKKEWTYPAGWESRWVKGNGEISWEGRRRFVGEAFVNDYVGLQPKRKGVWRVYYGPILIGELHEQERGVIRPAQYKRT